MPKGVPAAGFRVRGPNKNKLRSVIASGKRGNIDHDTLAKMLHVETNDAEVVIETDDEIRQKLHDRFEILAEMTNSSIQGKIRALIVSGPAGLGKSFEVEQAVIAEYGDEEAADDHIVKGYMRPLALYRKLYQHRDPGSVLVIDDADNIYTDEVSLNILKCACDTTKRRVISYRTESVLVDEETAELMPKSFLFEGTIIFITNLDFDTMIARGSKLSPHFEALMSRAHYIDLAMKTKRDYLIRIDQVVYGKGLLKREGLNSEQEAAVMKFITDNQNSLRELSLRIAMKIATLVKEFPKTWEKKAKITCCRAA